MNKVVVTGASGHIGFHVARVLRKSGYSPVLLVRNINPNIADLAQRGACVERIDFKNPGALVEKLHGAACLFHLAAENTTAQDAPQQTLDNTLGLTERVLTAAADAGVRTIVYTSSVVALGRGKDPNRLLSEADRAASHESPYVEGKSRADAFCERLMAERSLDIRRVYPSWVVGPDDLRGTPPHQIVRRFLQKPEKFYFSGGISIADVEEVARAHVAAWLKGSRQGAWVLGGDNVSFEQFFSLLAELSRRPKPSIYLPKWSIVTASTLLKIALKPFGKTPPVDPAYARAVIATYSWYDSSRAINELGYKIPPARESLERAILGERQRLAGVYSIKKLRHLEPARPSVSSPELPPLLLTGVPGWLGNRFLEQYLHSANQGRKTPPRRVRLLVEPRQAKLLDLPEGFDIAPADICDPDAVYKALDGIGTVFHLAGAIYPPKVATLYRVNFEGTRNLVDQCVKRKIRRILYMGTDSICGHGTSNARVFDEKTPDSPYRHYGRSKWLAERYILEKTAEGAIDGTSLRGFWFFGPGGPPRQLGFLKMMRWPRQLIFGNGKGFRSISHIDNTIAAFLAAETAPASYGKWYWIGDSKPDYTVDEIYSLLCQGCGNSFKPIHVPGAVCSLMRAIDSCMARFGRLHPTIHGIGKFNFDIAGRIDAAQRDFGYQPVITFKEYASRAYAEEGLDANRASK